MHDWRSAHRVRAIRALNSQTNNSTSSAACHHGQPASGTYFLNQALSSAKDLSVNCTI